MEQVAREGCQTEISGPNKRRKLSRESSTSSVTYLGTKEQIEKRHTFHVEVEDSPESAKEETKSDCLAKMQEDISAMLDALKAVPPISDVRPFIPNIYFRTSSELSGGSSLP